MINILKDLKRGDRMDLVFYVTFLRELGKLGKRIYKLRQEEWLKKRLIKIYEEIKIQEKAL